MRMGVEVENAVGILTVSYAFGDMICGSVFVCRED